MHSVNTCKLGCGHKSLFYHVLAFGADTHLIVAKGFFFSGITQLITASHRLTFIRADKNIITGYIAYCNSRLAFLILKTQLLL